MLTYILYLFLGLLAIGFVVFLHELGHFAAARMLGVEVEVLSYGMGPKVFSIYGRKTEYRLSLFLFGGYCRMKGSLDLMKALKDDSKYINRAEEGSYFGTSAFVRFLIYLAGPLTNFLLAVLLLSAASLIPVERLSDEAIVTPVTEYSALFSNPVSQESIHKGDKLISSSGHIFLDWQDAEDFIEEHSGERIPVTVRRDGKLISTELLPVKSGDGYAYGITNLQEAVIGRSLSPDFLPGDRVVEANGKSIRYVLDLYGTADGDFSIIIDRNGERLERKIEDNSFPFAWESNLRKSSETDHPFSYGLSRAAEMAAAALKALGAFFTLHLEDALTVLTGPVKAAESIGGITVLAFSESSLSGLRAASRLLAMVSVSIAVGNMLPIPTFDGGQMLINVIEMVKKVDDSDKKFLLQVYTIIKRHLDKKGRR